MKLVLLTIFISSGLLNAADTNKKTDLINTLLPEDSLIRTTHNKEPRGTAWFGCDSAKRSACDEIELALQYLFSKLRDGEERGYLTPFSVWNGDKHINIGCQEYFLYDNMRQHVRVLADCDGWGKGDTLAQNELKKIANALSPQWALAEELEQAYEEKQKIAREAKEAEEAVKRAKDAAVARAALLAYYKK